MNLENYFNNNPDRLIHKWTHYFEIYEELFSRFKGKKINILEIGLFQGGSIQMWQKYFGEDVQYFGVDFNPYCKQFEDKNVKVLEGKRYRFYFGINEKKLVGIRRVDAALNNGTFLGNEEI